MLKIRQQKDKKIDAAKLYFMIMKLSQVLLLQPLCRYFIYFFET